MPELTEDQFLAGIADNLARYVIAAGDEGPISRVAWDALFPDRPNPIPLSAADILEERALLLVQHESSGSAALLPDVTQLVDTSGRVHNALVEEMAAAQLLAAQATEAACAVFLGRALAARAARIAGLERLRRMRADLEHVEEAQ